MKNNDLNELFNAARTRDGNAMEKLSSEAIKGMSDEQKKTVERALSDPDFLNSLLSSDKARQIMKKLQGGE